MFRLTTWKQIKIIAIFKSHNGRFRKNLHLLAVIQFNGMSFAMTMAINNCDSHSVLHRQEIYSLQWVILCAMMHVRAATKWYFREGGGQNDITSCCT